MAVQKKAKSYDISGYHLKCPVCAHGKFWKREAQLNTKTSAMIGFRWQDPSGDCYICEHCRHILWFYREREKP